MEFLSPLSESESLGKDKKIGLGCSKTVKQAVANSLSMLCRWVGMDDTVDERAVSKDKGGGINKYEGGLLVRTVHTRTKRMRWENASKMAYDGK